VWVAPQVASDLPAGLWDLDATMGSNTGMQVETEGAGRYELHGVRPNEDLVVHARASGFAKSKSDPVRALSG